MQGDLVVRFFLHGLLLLAPDYDSATSDGTEVDSLRVLLVDAREGYRDITTESHVPMLMHCRKQGSDPCGSVEKITLANGAAFEDLRLSWKKKSSADPHADSAVTLDDIGGDVRDRQFPKRASHGSDYDWIASLSTALDQNKPLEVKAACSDSPPSPSRCPAVARLTFTEGTVSTCELVRGPKQGGPVVPAIRFVAPARSGRNRAMASIVKVELRQPLDQVEALVIDRTIWLNGDSSSKRLVISRDSFPDGCETEDNYCVDIAIANVPPKKPGDEWDAVGRHFRALYDLVELPVGTRTVPYPMVLWNADQKPIQDVQEACPMPKSFYKNAGFEVADRENTERRWWFTIEDRPICPPGTP